MTYAKSVSSILGEGSGELSAGKLTGDNWNSLNMARGTGTVYPGKRNKVLTSTFQPPEAYNGRNVVINMATKMRTIVSKMLIMYIIPHLRNIDCLFV